MEYDSRQQSIISLSSIVYVNSYVSDEKILLSFGNNTSNPRIPTIIGRQLRSFRRSCNQIQDSEVLTQQICVKYRILRYVAPNISLL